MKVDISPLEAAMLMKFMDSVPVKSVATQRIVVALYDKLKAIADSAEDQALHLLDRGGDKSGG